MNGLHLVCINFELFSIVSWLMRDPLDTFYLPVKCDYNLILTILCNFNTQFLLQLQHKMTKFPCNACIGDVTALGWWDLFINYG